MTIHIESLTFETIIGLLDFEQEKPQRVIIDLQASYDYSENQFIDYADMVLLIQNDLKEKRYQLLETALCELQGLLYSTYPNLKTLFLKISKPDILADCNVAISKTWHF
ncbi:MAG: hypothetical protein RLZZ428_1073 [Pseudomonadota bacterium]|jgi:dihydroneopterin aldolase